MRTDEELAAVRERVEREAWPLTVAALLFLATTPRAPKSVYRQGRPASDWVGRPRGANAWKSYGRSYADV